MNAPAITKHPRVDRLASLGPGPFTVADVADVFQVQLRAARRLLINGDIAHLKTSIGVNTLDGSHKPKHYRREVTAGAILLYLIKSTEGDKTDLLDAIKLRFPQHLEMCQAAAEGRAIPAQEAPPLPAGVVDAREAFKARKGKTPPLKPCGPGDEYQPDLFDAHAHLTSHPVLMGGTTKARA